MSKKLSKRVTISIKQMGFPSGEWARAVESLVEGVHELISPTGELNLHTSSLGLVDIRALAERVRQLEADDEDEGH